MGDQFFSFYDVAIQEKILKDTVFSAIDFETTGLYPVQDRIIEIGIVKFTLEEILDTYETFIDPERDLPDKITEICGITPLDLIGAPVMGEVLETVHSFLDETVPIAHNLNFDYGFLKSESARYDRSYEIDWGIDTLSLAKKVFKNQPGYSLQKLGTALGLDKGNAHRALDDAFLCQKLFLKALQSIENHKDWTVEELFRYSNTRLK